jgi:hypothetical protein
MAASKQEADRSASGAFHRGAAHTNTVVKLGLAVSALLLLGVVAVLGARLISSTSQEPNGGEKSQQQAFQSWRNSALPVILEYRQALAAAQTPGRAPRLATRVLTVERTRATLVRLAATLQAHPPIATHEFRRLDTMLAQAIRLAIDGERNYALGLRDRRNDLKHRAKLQLDHSAAVLFYMSLRANAIGTQLTTGRTEG